MPHTLTADVDLIAADLNEAFSLNFTGAVSNLDQPLIRWLDYRLRYIDPASRQILKSEGFDGRVSLEAKPALDAFIRLIGEGADLNPYQTKTIKHNDTSGKKSQLRTDSLWADWGLHHVHLTELPIAPSDEFSARSEWLLFFLALPGHIALVDVRSHNEPGIFQAIDLVETTIRSWPEVAERFRVKGIAGLARQPSTDAESLKTMRKSGVTQFLEVDGKVYMPPGVGVTTAATSTRVSLARDSVLRNAQKIGDFFSHDHSPVVQAAKAKGIAEPVIGLKIDRNGSLIVACEAAAEGIAFPAPPKQNDARTELELLLFPQWARTKLLAYLTAKEAPPQ
jgi:hypothetical protein